MFDIWNRKGFKNLKQKKMIQAIRNGYPLILVQWEFPLFPNTDDLYTILEKKGVVKQERICIE